MSSSIDEQEKLGVLTLEEFKLWSQQSLKVFLSLRKKSTVGSTETLVARAYAAYEERIPVDSSKEHAERVLLQEYKNKLLVDGKELPDPLSLKQGWKGEEEGMKFWPKLYLTDITRFYKNVLGKSDIIQCIECEYKQGKAYRYFTNNFIGEVFINNSPSETASKFYQVGNMGKNLRADHTKTCPEYLVADILGVTSIPQTWQMKHGINTEIHAKKIYIHEAKKHHRQFSYNDPGMKIFEEYPYLSASPDLEINCSCHVPGLVEIKCPATLIGKVPSVENYKHIEIKDNEIALKENSPYYAQVQGQMAATNRSYCDFFVFSFKGTVKARTYFSSAYWETLLSNLVYFWKNVVAMELLTKNIEKNMERFFDESEIIKVLKPSSINSNEYASELNEKVDFNVDFADIYFAEMDIIKE